MEETAMGQPAMQLLWQQHQQQRPAAYARYTTDGPLIAIAYKALDLLMEPCVAPFLIQDPAIPFASDLIATPVDLAADLAVVWRTVLVLNVDAIILKHLEQKEDCSAGLWQARLRSAWM